LEPIPDNKAANQLTILSKYNTFFMYLYPILINMSGRHRVLRDKTIDVMLNQIHLFNDAIKSNQVGKLYIADSGIATLRELLRILSDEKVKLLSQKQYGVSSLHLAEVGKILGSWIKQKS
jgi:hypothetical protein